MSEKQAPRSDIIPLEWPLLIHETEKLLALPPDWDDEGSDPPSEIAWRRAIVFVLVQVVEGYHRHSVWLPACTISPGPEGSIDLQWGKDSGYLLVNVTADKPINWYGRRDGESPIRGKSEGIGYQAELVSWLLK